VRRVSNRVRTLVTFVVGILALVLWPSRADAYPWMIRHEYNNCIACHTDPSGGGLLTPYGRAQSQVLLSTKYSNEEVNPGKFIFFAGFAELPNSVNLGAWFRTGYIKRPADNPGSGDNIVAMRYDFQAQFNVDKVKFNVSVGLSPRDEARGQSQLAWVTRRQGPLNGTLVPKEVQVVSREHWVGYEISDAMLLRAGRINLPFGLRNFEHNSWVRDATRTDYNQGQQHGATFAFGNEHLRTEVMGILGNFQVGPDTFRERGYAGYVEFVAGQYQAIGFSSMMTYAGTDLRSQGDGSNFRQAHGPYTRYTITKPVVLLAEVDVLTNSFKDQPTRVGWTGFGQLDIEPVQGFHILGTGEFLRPGLADFATERTNFGVWGGLWWFPIPHLDVRFDMIHRFGPAPYASNTTYLAQLHVYL
jgi:hypothetical protein